MSYSSYDPTASALTASQGGLLTMAAALLTTLLYALLRWIIAPGVAEVLRLVERQDLLTGGTSYLLYTNRGDFPVTEGFYQRVRVGERLSLETLRANAPE